MNFNELCKDFEARKPRIGTETNCAHFASIEWVNGNNSSNDLLVRHLRGLGVEYLRDFNGTIWFLYDGIWTNCKVNYDRDTNTAHFSRCVYAA